MCYATFTTVSVSSQIRPSPLKEVAAPPPPPPLPRYTLRCLVAVPPDTDCVTTIKSTEEKLAAKKKELETFQVTGGRRSRRYSYLFSPSSVRSRRSTMQLGRDWRMMSRKLQNLFRWKFVSFIKFCLKFLLKIYCYKQIQVWQVGP